MKANLTVDQNLLASHLSISKKENGTYVLAHAGEDLIADTDLEKVKSVGQINAKSYGLKLFIESSLQNHFYLGFKRDAQPQLIKSEVEPDVTQFDFVEGPFESTQEAVSASIKIYGQRPHEGN